MELAAAAIVARSGLHAAGRTLATELANAVPLPFTSVNCSEVNPTGSKPGRMPRKAAMARKIGFRIARGSGIFPSIMTCVLTWRRWNLDVSDMLLKVLSGT